MTITLPRRRIQVGEHFIDYRRSSGASDGPTLILVHGIGVSGRYFLPLAEELAKFFSVIVVDLPGYGKTPKPKQTLTIVELSEILQDFILHQDINQPVLIGHSMGCQIVAHLACAISALSPKSVLLSPTVNEKERNIFIQGFRLLQDTFHESPAVRRIVVRDYMRMGLFRYLKTSRYMITDHLEETLRRCSSPVLIIRGQKDKIVPRDWVKMLAEQHSDIQTREITGAPHVVQCDDIKQLVWICREFIRE